MKKNDTSEYFEDWTTKKLKQEAINYHETIYGETACYGRRDLMAYDGICQELEKRGIGINSQISFS